MASAATLGQRTQRSATACLRLPDSGNQEVRGRLGTANSMRVGLDSRPAATCATRREWLTANDCLYNWADSRCGPGEDVVFRREANHQGHPQ